MTLYDFLAQFITPGITEGGLIVIAILVTVCILAIFVFPKLFNIVKQNAMDTAEIKAQVKNDHSTDLREESDARHQTITNTLAELVRGVEGVREDVRHNRERIDHVGDKLDQHLEDSR